MKELSIEEKAKAYDEAIKRAREWYNELEPDSYTCVVESIFPEFKEFEDERIRKWLISQLKIKLDDTNSDLNIKIDKAISWLEKQGEPNPYSGVSFKYNGHTWGMCARDNGVEILVDGEIKERVFLDSKPQGKSALEAINKEKVDNANKVEPRQDEFTNFEKAVKQVMEEAIECGDTHNLKADAEMLLNLAHNSSWSEEDETNLRRTEYAVMKFFGGDCSLVDWLRKSLKERYTWKPSDEQLKMLDEVIDVLHRMQLFGGSSALIFLKHDLEKLRGGQR